MARFIYAEVKRKNAIASSRLEGKMGRRRLDKPDQFENGHAQAAKCFGIHLKMFSQLSFEMAELC